MLDAIKTVIQPSKDKPKTTPPVKYAKASEPPIDHNS